MPNPDPNLNPVHNLAIKLLFNPKRTVYQVMIRNYKNNLSLLFLKEEGEKIRLVTVERLMDMVKETQFCRR